MLSLFWDLGIVLINLLNNIEQFKFKKFIVNDINKDIINFYILLKEEYGYLKKYLKQIENCYNSIPDLKAKEEYYYCIRDKFNTTNKKIRTVYFLFLMKTGFNGVYRENSKGQFNVPFGKKEQLRIDYGNLEYISKLIQNVEFYNLDYIEFYKTIKIKKRMNNVFLYCDPPYLPEDAIINQKQLLYTKEMFDHRSFVNNMIQLKSAKYMISMTNSKNANEIYGELEKCTARELIRTINPKKSFRSTEVIFSNYKINKNIDNNMDSINEYVQMNLRLLYV